MRGLIDNANWENFLDDYFGALQASVEKTPYPNGLTLHAHKHNIYVWCDLSLDRVTIKQLEFGRLLRDAQGNAQTIWIKGVFVKRHRGPTTFLQTSFDGEFFHPRAPYTLQFDHLNTGRIRDFLRTSCLHGWHEDAYLLDKDTYYKVIVHAGRRKWTVKLKTVQEQDLPFAYDAIAIWCRTAIADAFWNRARRTMERVFVQPMKG